MVTDIYFLNPTENMLCKIENYLRKSEYEEETINDSTCRFRKGETFIDVCEGGDSVGKYITVVCSGVNNEMLRKLLCICPECGSKYVNCDACPYKKECIKGNNCKIPLDERTKTLQVAKTFLKYRQEDLERILSEEGILFRTNRSIQAEGSFPRHL